MEAVSIPSATKSQRADRLSEATDIHTRILRLALGIEESRSYWEHVDPRVPPAQRALPAFEQRWFGAKSLERVRFLLSSFVDRYDLFPEGLAVLQRWRSMDAATRQVVCASPFQSVKPASMRRTGGDASASRRGSTSERARRSRRTMRS